MSPKSEVQCEVCEDFFAPGKMNHITVRQFASKKRKERIIDADVCDACVLNLSILEMLSYM